MKRLLTGLAAASLIGLPLTAAAHHEDRGWRGDDECHHGKHWRGPTHVHRHYYRPGPPPVVYYPYYPAPVVARPVYVPVPAPYPPVDGPRVSVGFRIVF